METNAPPFPVKLRNVKKISEAAVPGINLKRAIVPPRGKRIFGTTRNPNIPLKAAPERPLKEKPPFRLSKKAAIAPETRSSQCAAVVSVARNSSEKRTVKKKTRSVGSRPQSSSAGNSMEPRTPVRRAPARPRAATPYLSAERCSNCRFDKLETSSHWLGQIKLAESVGKHFVSAAFFSLALDCQAEPQRNIRIELKKYVARHDYLNDEMDWQKLLQSYGLVKFSMDKGKEMMGGEEKRAFEDSVHSISNSDSEQEEGEHLNPSRDCCTKQSQGIQLFT